MDLMLVVAGATTGFLVGLTGMGGGALMTPLLLLLFGVAPLKALGTDLWFAYRHPHCGDESINTTGRLQPWSWNAEFMAVQKCCLAW
jgi:hypothetical protein